VQGQNIAIESRWADGKYDRLPGLAAGLVSLKLDIIVTTSLPAIQAAKQATGTIPIVMATSLDPVSTGFVASLARPGGNITGLSAMAPELVGKQLELLKEVVPKVSRVALLGNPANPGTAPMVRRTQDTARELGIQLQRLEARSPSEIDGAFAAKSALSLGDGGPASDNVNRPFIAPVSGRRRGFKIAHGALGQRIRAQERACRRLEVRLAALPERVLVKAVMDEEEIVKFGPEAKHLTDTIKMVAYRAETALVRCLASHYARTDDTGRALIREMLSSSVDVLPDAQHLRIRLHSLANPRSNQALAHVCVTLNALS
jgi:ABC transporter substrate binding protein/Transposase protein